MSVKNSYLSGLCVFIMLLALPWQINGQQYLSLPRSIPEAEGVESAGLLEFLNAVDTSDVELHSFMFLRHGKVIAEGWWDPYGPAFKHIMFSASKTFTATAIGLAISENRLKLTDRVIAFFPYSLPDTIGKNMQELTVQHLLTMSVGQNPEPRAMGNSGDWIRTFLDAEPVNKPGAVFMYNNMATFMLSAILQQVTGQTLFEYLRPRIFKPLGIQGIDWDLNPQGINLGMIGLRLHTEDMAKFGQLLLQGGVWNNVQLIPKEWVREALSYRIATVSNTDPKMNEQSDWNQGYGYQMWRGRNNTVRLDGLGGQFVVIIPDKDAVIVFTANASNTQKELNFMHNFLIPAIKSDKALKPNQAAHDELQRRLAALSIKSPLTGNVRSDFENKISGREFVVENSPYNIQSVYFTFDHEGCKLTLKRDNKFQSIGAGSEKWVISCTELTSFLSPAGNVPSKSIDANYKLTQYFTRVGARYAWTDDRLLEITGRFMEESLGYQTIVCKFFEFGGDVRLSIETKTPQIMGGRPGMVPSPASITGIMLKIE